MDRAPSRTRRGPRRPARCSSRSSRSRWSRSAPRCCCSARCSWCWRSAAPSAATARRCSAGSAPTILCGMFFVGMQVYEFTHFVHEGLTLQTNLFGASFFTLTGFHGTHVTIGVIWLITLLDPGAPGQASRRRSRSTSRSRRCTGTSWTWSGS